MKAGDRIMDANGYGLVFRQTAADTNGQLMEMDAYYRPHGEPPPPHYHPQQRERFQVMSGRFRVLVDGQYTSYSPGDTFEVPAGASHAMHNESAEKGHLLWQTRPALRSEEFFAALWSLELQNTNGQRGGSRLLQLALLFDEYRPEVCLTSTGQRTVLRLLAPVARLLGKRPPPPIAQR